MTLRHETVVWLGALGALALLLWLLSSILLPFVLGMAVGYFLDPVVEWLARRGLSRATTAGLLILSFFAIGMLSVLLLLPPLVEQSLDFAHRLPTLFAALYAWLQPLLARGLAGVVPGTVGDLTAPLGDLAQRAVGGAAGMLGNIVSRGLALVNVVSLLAVTPLVAFYLLRDWPRIIAQIDGWLPRAHAATIREQARAIDAALAGYARGAAIVCATLGVFYAVALSAVGLDFGLMIGLGAGALSFVPYLGFIVGLVSSVGVALYQFWPNGMRVAIVLAIFLTGQAVSDYVLTPRLVGERIGLHPLWVVFGVFAGGALFGFLGVLLAVPACAAIGVVARFSLARYKGSALYLGGAPGPLPPQEEDTGHKREPRE
jgi:predicted PurR-regulated permease PerM